jgi:hypothetical protein
MVHDEAIAAVADNTKIPRLKLYYNTKIKGDATGAKATTLHTINPLVTSFPHYLAQLPPDNDLLEMWEDYLKQIRAAAEAAAGGTGDRAVGAVSILRDPAHALFSEYSPLNQVLAIAGLNAAGETAREKIVKLLVEKDIATVVAEVTPANVDKLLTAMRTQESAANFEAVFAVVAAGAGGLKAISWAATNRAKALVASGQTIQDVMNGFAAPTIPPSLIVGATALAVRDVNQAVTDRGAAAGVRAASLAKARDSVLSVSFIFDVAINTPATALALANQAVVGTADKFSNFLAKLPVTAPIKDVWTKYLNHLGPANALAQIKFAGAGPNNAPFKLLTDFGRDIDDDDKDPRFDVIVQMAKVDDGTGMAVLSGNETSTVLDAILNRDHTLATLNKVIRSLSDAKINAFGVWAAENISATLTDGANPPVTVKAVFKAEYERAGRIAAGKEKMHNALLEKIYTDGSISIIEKAKEHSDASLAIAGNEFLAAIEAIDPGNAVPIIDAIKSNLVGDDAMAAIDGGTPGAWATADQTVLKKLVVKGGIDAIKELIASGELLPRAALGRNNFNPFLAASAANNATLLYALLAKAEADLGGNVGDLDHPLIDNGPARNGLATTLKNASGMSAFEWHAYASNGSNLSTGEKTDADLVRPHAVDLNEARTWLAY